MMCVCVSMQIYARKRARIKKLFGVFRRTLLPTSVACYYVYTFFVGNRHFASSSKLGRSGEGRTERANQKKIRIARIRSRGSQANYELMT